MLRNLKTPCVSLSLRLGVSRSSHRQHTGHWECSGKHKLHPAPIQSLLIAVWCLGSTAGATLERLVPLHPKNTPFQWHPFSWCLDNAIVCGIWSQIQGSAHRQQKASPQGRSCCFPIFPTSSICPTCRVSLFGARRPQRDRQAHRSHSPC